MAEKRSPYGPFQAKGPPGSRRVAGPRCQPCPSTPCPFGGAARAVNLFARHGRRYAPGRMCGGGRTRGRRRYGRTGADRVRAKAAWLQLRTACARRRAAPGTFSAGRFYGERFRRRTTSSAVRCSPVQRAAGRRGYRDERRQGDEQLPSGTNSARPHGEHQKQVHFEGFC